MNTTEPTIIKAKNLKKGDRLCVAGMTYSVKRVKKNAYDERVIIAKREHGLTSLKVLLVMVKNSRVQILKRKK